VINVILFLDLSIKGVFGTPPEHLSPAQFHKIKLDNDRISDKYRCALHKQFETILGVEIGSWLKESTLHPSSSAPSIVAKVLWYRV
jgi:hypothetical protein